MTAGIRALMSGAIDYAGLFPPAKLPLEDAVDEFLRIRESSEAWMLGGFVIPASRITELEPWSEALFHPDLPLSLSLLGRAAEDIEVWRTQFKEDMNHAGEFVAPHADGISTVNWEVPLTRRDAALGSLTDIPSTEQTTTVFCEIPKSPGADGARFSMIKEIASINRAPALGFKFRTGGVTADAFPTVEQFAGIIFKCHQHHCRWKATAGLHHPMRHADSQLGVKMHGFLNVLFAAVLASAHDLPETTLSEILAEEDAASFHVTDDGIRWRDYSADVSQIESTRQTTFQSFGSCSFDEPRDDLKTLDFL